MITNLRRSEGGRAASVVPTLQFAQYRSIFIYYTFRPSDSWNAFNTAQNAQARCFAMLG
jgi:hypothetical protein